MRITDVRVRKSRSNDEEKLKGYADITIEGSFVVHGLKVIEGKNGMFVAMPSRKMPNGEYKDVAHPITTEVRNMITEAVITKYQNLSEDDEYGSSNIDA